MSIEYDTHTIIDIGSEEEFAWIIKESSVPVVVDLWAPWCAPCRMQEPILEECAAQWGAHALIAKVNVDVVPGIVEQLCVQGIPTLIIFRDGRELRRLAGVQSVRTLAKALWVSEDIHRRKTGSLSPLST